jgi:hypothetical protein
MFEGRDGNFGSLMWCAGRGHFSRCGFVSIVQVMRVRNQGNLDCLFPCYRGDEIQLQGGVALVQ